MNTKPREDNPFEDERVAQEWITAVEGEQGLIRDNETYPLLKRWSGDIKALHILEIGAGQGICATKLSESVKKYVGVEPSDRLVGRANELYKTHTREFLIGNAYDLPCGDESFDSVFSVNVWFHLEDLETASKEMARVLQAGGNFLISTANPKSYNYWLNMYEDPHIEGKVIDGKVNVPVQSISRNRFYKHTMQEIVEALEKSNLTVTKTEDFGGVGKFTEHGLFVNIYGHKQ